MGAAHGSALRINNTEIELRRETKDFARWTIEDVVHVHTRFQKTFGLAVTASQFEDLILLKAPETVAVTEVFDALDTNGDGRIDGLEFLAALACVCRASFEDKARFAFDLFDFNHNGSLSVTEMALLMKSVWVGMALLTGQSMDPAHPNQHAHTLAFSSPQLHASSAKRAEDAVAAIMRSCVELAASAFARFGKDASAALSCDEFIDWARSNRAFMLQVEHFRLLADKAIGFEDELSLPDASDVDSDLDDEWQHQSGSAPTASPHMESALTVSSLHLSSAPRSVELPAPYIIEPSQPHLATKSPFVGVAAGATSSGNTGAPQRDMPPPVNLALEWIYGASGPSARNTCRYLRTGDVVYVVSKFAVVYSRAQHQQRFYQRHRRAIQCLDVNAAGEIIATGDAASAGCSGAPEIHIWSGLTLQCLAVLQNFHVDGVAQLSFPAPASAASATMHSANSTVSSAAPAHLNASVAKKKAHTECLVASVGSDANVSMALWDWQHGKLLATGRAHPSSGKRVLALALSEDATEVLVCGARFVLFHQLDGRFFKPKRPQAMERKLTTLPACVTGAYYGAHHAVVGTTRGQLLQFQRHKLTKLVQAHTNDQSVNACLLACRAMVLFTAGKDAHIKQWDATLSPIGHTIDLHALLTQCCASGSASAGRAVRDVLESDDLRISSLAYDAARHKLLVGTRMGHILELADDASSSHLSGGGGSGDTRVRVIASSHDGRAVRCVTMARTGVNFATCGVTDRSLKLWSLRRRIQVQRLRLAFAPSVAEFSNSGERIAVGGLDGSILLLESAPPLRTVATMKNTNSVVTALRFAPQDDALAVACANGLVYLYTLDDSGRRFKRLALLKPFETELRDATDRANTAAATSLDFSIDGAFLKSQHGNGNGSSGGGTGAAALRFWDLRQRACERVTAMNVVRNVIWQTYSSSIGWHVSGLARSVNHPVSVQASMSQTLLLTLDARGKLALTHFPCAAAQDPNQQCVWLEKAVDDAHLVINPRQRQNESAGTAATGSDTDCHPCAGFALNDSAVVSSSCHDGVICQWRVEKELRDEQPRVPVAYDNAMLAQLARFGLEDIYFGWDADTEFVARRQLPSTLAKVGLVPQVAVSETSVRSTVRRMEAPDLDLTLAYVYGLNVLHTTLNQGLACAGGNGAFVYAAGTLVVLEHTDQRKVQRVFQSGLTHSVACLVKHAMHPIVALGSREDGKLVVWNIESQRKVAELPSSNGNERTAVLIAAAFEDASSSESDLAAAIWKSAHHVHSLVFYSWRRQDVVAQAHMTQLPVLFGFFCGSTSGAGSSGGADADSAVSVQAFVTGGVDHITFWRLDTACGHVQSQQGVFGRHALVQTLVCGVYVRPFVLTGTASGCVIIWEDSVAAYTLAGPFLTHSMTTSSMHSDANAIVTLLHVPSTQQVIGATQCGAIAVWKYAKSSTSASAQCRASSFLEHVITLDIFALDWRFPSSAASSLRSASLTGAGTGAIESDRLRSSASVRSVYLLEETNGVLAVLTNGHVVHVDAKLLTGSNSIGNGITAKQPRGSARVVLEHNQQQRDVALHPRDFAFATCCAGGSVCVWSLHTHTLLKRCDLPVATHALAYSSAGDRIAVSRADGMMSILDARTLDTVAEFACGPSPVLVHANALVPPKWCSKLQYSPLGSALNCLALACRDFNVYVYAYSSSSDGDGGGDRYELLHEFVGHTARIEALDFSLDGAWLQSSSSSLDAQILRWRLQVPSNTGESVTAGVCTLADDEWSSWSNTFAGPVGGLSELFGTTVTALARIQSDDVLVRGTKSSEDAAGSSSSSSSPNKWSSLLPTMVVGTESGAVLLCWYPLPLGDAQSSLAKEYVGFFPADASVRSVAFSFANNFVVACARTYCDDAVVLVWQTDYDEELRQLERNPVVHAPPAGLTHPTGSGTSALVLAATHARHDELASVDTSLFELDPLLKESVSGGGGGGDEFLAVKPWLGAVREPSVVPDGATSGALPDDELALEFVYGVNAGATASNNVFYADDAWEIVYAGAAVGIVYNTKTQSQLFNQGHQSRLISAMAVHPKGDLVVTGECGVRTNAKLVLWDANSGSTIAQVDTSHTRGVQLLAFSPNGDSVVSIGMDDDHVMSVFALGSGEGTTTVKLLASVKTSKQPVSNLCFTDDSGGIVTCGRQHILFWQPLGSGAAGTATAGAMSMKRALFSSHTHCRADTNVLAVARFVKQQVVSSQSDGSLYVWRDRRCVDVKLLAHAAAIPTLVADRKKQLVFSGGGDGKICVWNAQLECVKTLDIAQLAASVQPPLTSVRVQNLCVRDDRFLIATAGGEICELIELSAAATAPATGAAPSTATAPSSGYRCVVHVRSHCKGELWGLATHPNRLQFATAGDDGYVRLWDAPTRSLLALHAWKTGGLPRALAFSSDGSHVAVGSTDGYVRVLSGVALESVVIEWRCFVTRSGGVRVLKYSPDGEWLAVGCHDQRVHIFDAHTYKKHGELRGHSGTVTHLDFAKDARVLQSAAAGAGELLFWNVRALTQIASASAVRDVAWASWSSPFGWPVQGIWPLGSDGSDINTVSRSADQRVVATGDDDGLVRLLRYPSATLGGAPARARVYAAHASHVTSCAFTKGDMFLLSTGGRDQSVCQFKLRPVAGKQL